MSVKPLDIGKKFLKVDSKQSLKTIKSVDKSNNKKSSNSEYYYESSNNGNINVNDLFNILINKIDSIGSVDNIYGEIKKTNGHVEVDIKKDIFIDNIKTSKLESEVTKGKVKTKKDKLKALRRRNKK